MNSKLISSKSIFLLSSQSFLSLLKYFLKILKSCSLLPKYILNFKELSNFLMYSIELIK